MDLLIRTSGEQRISNFLLWQIAYAELYFSEVFGLTLMKHILKKQLLATKNENVDLETSEQLTHS